MDLRPYPAEWTVERGLDEYLRENGFTREAYDDDWAHITVWKVSFSIPSPPARRWAIKLHDVHHVVTGYGTDLVGEWEISAWETGRGGLRHLSPYVFSIVASGALAGFVFAPRRAWRAWSHRGDQVTLFDPGWDYEQVLRLTIGELREAMGIPQEGLVRSRELHSGAPSRA